MSSGRVFREAVNNEQPLQIVGAINALCARMAERSGFKALYLSGAGVANATLALPDLAVTTLSEVLEEAKKITASSSLPLLVDIDTGFGHRLNIQRCIQECIRSGVAAVHLEDQVGAKRCGHRPGKSLVSVSEMTDRLKAAVDARTDETFVIMARTDAAAQEGLSGAITRAKAYVEAGADMIFAEALTSLEDYQTFCQQVSVPVLANSTEFGKTPLFTREAFKSVGVRMILYPLSAFRAMNKAAWNTYQTIRHDGTQQACVPSMQTRAELYELLNYEYYEQQFDQAEER